MSSPKSIGNILNNTILKLNGLQPPAANLPEQSNADTPETSPQEFIHPILTPEDFKQTKINYNKYIEAYNKKVDLDNFKINAYNTKVIAACRNLKKSKDVRMRELIWKEANKELDPETYNEEVEKYNDKYGYHIRKKVTRQKVKPATREYFMAFLWEYNAQLYKRKEFRTNPHLQINVPGSLPKYELYPNKILESEYEGARNLSTSTVETIRNHRERLEEAGVLWGYEYHGSNRALKIAFNVEVLSITDNGKPKSTRNGAQAVREEQTKKVRHNNVSSSEPVLVNTKYRQKGVVANAPTSLNCTGSSTRPPKKQGEKKIDAGAAQQENQEKKFAGAKSQNELSQILITSLEDKNDLARQLAQLEHKDYKPLDIAIARQEAYYGTMHPKDFKELAIQDIFKFSNSLFEALDVHPGSWNNAYKIWLKEMFKNFNGQQLKKDVLLERWQKMIDVLRAVKRQQAKKGWQPSYPSRYFDPVRTEKCHNSFAYAYKNFRIEPPETPDAEYQKRKINANRSKRWNTDLEKARPKIRQFLRGKLDLQKMMDYVKYNCPEVYKALPKLIAQEKDEMFKNLTLN
ncbi:hypothetical protein [Zunongwangia atlantica]|uniref:Uncharacterized protein n=1 Tax=Zunongwangia atlantica 22II14-10F7 TaxID=1185767 RepID=A0A1Y1SYG5_9FLAO|nr:hypothetical protein [Zunongwangia atlantica]ORL43799.1 hypothetical protein IIF7_19144 [Zunongwangia atlantica 22II14-10F7]